MNQGCPARATAAFREDMDVGLKSQSETPRIGALVAAPTRDTRPSVSGTVYEVSTQGRRPLPGVHLLVTVRIDGSTHGTTTNADGDGRYTIPPTCLVNRRHGWGLRRRRRWPVSPSAVCCDDGHQRPDDAGCRVQRESRFGVFSQEKSPIDPTSDVTVPTTMDGCGQWPSRTDGGCIP